MRKFTILLSFSASLALLTSCGDFSSSERNHPHFVKAKRARNNNNYVEAAKLYEKYLLINPKSAKAHNEIATLYDIHLDSPLLAIYHYRQYLKYSPESQDAQTVYGYLEGSEKKYYLMLKEKYKDNKLPPETVAELEKLRKQNKMMKTYILRKNKEQKKKYPATTPLQKQTKKQTKEKPINAGITLVDRKDIPQPARKVAAKKKNALPKFYTVKNGDTLRKISKNIYGTPKYYKLIFKTNSNLLPSEAQLVIGQRLRIPPLPSKEIEKNER